MKAARLNVLPVMYLAFKNAERLHNTVSISNECGENFITRLKLTFQDNVIGDATFPICHNDHYDEFNRIKDSNQLTLKCKTLHHFS